METNGITRRSFLIRSSLLGSAVVAAPALLSACGTSSGGSSSSSTSSGSSAKGPGFATSSSGVLAKAKKQGYISIGVANEHPYGYILSNGTVTGEAPAVAKAIFKNLGVPKLNATAVAFDSLIPGMNSGHFDMVCAGMDITPARCKQAAYSIPDYQALVAFLVPKGNPKGIKNFADVKRSGVAIAGETGAVEITYATSSGVPSSQIKTYSDPSEMLSAVTTGRAYAAMLTDISLKTLAKQNPNANVEVTAGFKPTVNGKPTAEVGGFVFRMDEADLISQFNAQLRKLHANGEWLKIVKPFGFTKGNIPPSSVTLKSLCA